MSNRPTTTSKLLKFFVLPFSFIVLIFFLMNEIKESSKTQKKQSQIQSARTIEINDNFRAISNISKGMDKKRMAYTGR
ncbi:MAG TPA: hypothetical protein EYG86_02310 [Crocinitomicaceae bacterium]|nr:hypothetical protein [Crocinitomicaceae bacterium]